MRCNRACLLDQHIVVEYKTTIIMLFPIPTLASICYTYCLRP
jgi:hypothetical protein